MKRDSSSSSWSESSVHIVNTASSHVSAGSSVRADQRSGHSYGTTKVVVDAVTLEASFALQSGILKVELQAFDGADPRAMRLRDTLLLKPGQRRTICVQRALGRSPRCFTIARIGDGLQVSADGSQ
jgi:hypothetical protein